MKKLPALLNTPVRVVAAVGLIVLLGELLIMLLIESIHTIIMKDVALEKVAFEFIDPILLIAIASPALYILILRPMRRQQTELARQVDELRRFQKMAVGRELRIKELVEEITALRHPLSAETQLTTSSPEKPRDEAAQPASTSEMEAEQRSALLFMLEDLEAGRKKVERAHQEWMAALDVVEDPIFLHDAQFRILRCNKAYQKCAGLPFHEIIGQLYYEVFPKADSPLPNCLQAMEKAEEEEEEEEVTVDGAIYRLRAYSIRDEQGAYLYSVHTLEDITEHKQAEVTLHESEEKFHKITESAQDAIIMLGSDQRISFWNAAAARIFGYTAAEAMGQALHALITPASDHAAFARAFPHFQQSGEGPIIGKLIEVSALRKGGKEFPVELSISATQLNGQWNAIGIVRDITERKHQEERTIALLELSISAETLDEKTLLQRGLDTVQHLTDSRIGFLHFVSEDQNEIELVTWSSDTLAHYCQADFARHYPVSEAGIWADCIRLKQPVIINDYATAPDKKGLPEGHADVQRFISVPVFEGEQVRMIVGVGNAARDYDEHDVETVKLFSYDLYRVIQRKRAIKSLEENEQHYRAVTESAKDSIITAAGTGNIIEWNAAAERLFGYTRAEVIGQSLTVLMPVRFHNLHRAGLARVVAGGVPHLIGKSVEVFGLHKDGSEFPLEISLAQWQAAKGQFFTAIIRDITERKKAEVKIKEQLDFLERFQKVAVKREFRIKELTDAAEKQKTGIGTEHG